jgi:putative ATPase
MARARRVQGKATLLFVDEIHRFNRAQQDSFLPVMEDGTVILVGATTENPSFELNAAVLSRAQVLVLNRLTTDDLEQLLQRAEALTKEPLPLDTDARTALKAMADGDGRFLLNLVEEIQAQKITKPLTTADLARTVQKRAPIYDKGREGHYNLVSALHKSVRGSDPDAALYWLARMLAGGEDPLYITRRVVRMAVEDIGLADPRALTLSLAAKDAYDFLGSPEGELAIAQAVIFLACAPKSNAAYTAFGAAMEAANRTGSLNPPMHILNAPTRMMKDLGYGKGYVYDPDTPQGFSGQNYFPDAMPREAYYTPAGDGLEKEIKARLERWAALRGKP